MIDATTRTKLETHYGLLKNVYDEQHDVLAHRRNCASELARMESISIDGGYTSLRDYLNADLNLLAVHSENPAFGKYVESSEELNRIFPYYGFLLKLQFEKGRERMPILREAMLRLDWLIGSRNVPSSCLEMILAHASNAEMKNLIAATEPASLANG